LAYRTGRRQGASTEHPVRPYFPFSAFSISAFQRFSVSAFQRSSVSLSRFRVFGVFRGGSPGNHAAPAGENSRQLA
jgi:hypothetical protein